LPLYILGFMGMPRRMQHYSNLAWHPYLIVAAFGVALIAFGILAMMMQLAVSIKERHANRDLTGDPWDGHTLEWATSSPPPPYNFAIIPVVHNTDALRELKEKGTLHKPPEHYHDILMPKNTARGFIIGGLAFLFGFSVTWWMWWLALLSLFGIVFTVILRGSDDDWEHVISAAEVERIEKERYQQLAESRA
jgi:cytochrome o ubiquinol oxidase subunit 1